MKRNALRDSQPHDRAYTELALNFFTQSRQPTQGDNHDLVSTTAVRSRRDFHRFLPAVFTRPARTGHLRLRRSAGLDGSGIVIHTLRHQAASMMLAAGTDLETLRNIMGHADLSTTQIYLHASGQSLREGADSIEDYLANARAKETF
jgi:integrase